MPDNDYQNLTDERTLDLFLVQKKIVCFGDSIKGDGLEGGENYPSYLQKLLT